MEDLTHLEESTIADLAALDETPKKDRVIEKIQVLSGSKPRYAINDHFFSNVRKEIRYIFTYDERPEMLKQLFRKAVRRGIKIRFIATSRSTNARKFIREDQKEGVEIRYLNVQEIRLQIMDDREARITVVNPKDRKDKTTIYFQHTQMAKHLADYFDVLWERAEELI